jgi:hypothetical protein
MRVLVTEDDEILAMAVAAGLRREGMAVDAALDGDAALQRLAVMLQGTQRARSRLATLGGLKLGSLAFAARQPARSVRNAGAGGQTINHHAGGPGDAPPGRDRWEAQCRRRSSSSLWP